MTRLAEMYQSGGQSPWLDYIRRDMLENGELVEWIRHGVRGVTSNPTILENAIAKSDIYVYEIKKLSSQGQTSEQIYETIAIADITSACEQFMPLYQSSNGGDGFVSLEVSPVLSHDSQGSIHEGLRLWGLIDRPNLMIKIPSTEAGVIATRELISQGVNVNVTLMFSEEDYLGVAEAYLSGLEDRVRRGLSCSTVRSVASLFVSRIDAALEKDLEHRKDLAGRVAIANARRLYRSFQRIFSSARFLELQTQGAHVQRPLFASTGTKNPIFSDVLYVNSLILPATVNTMPTPTLTAFLDHGAVQAVAPERLEEDDRVLAECENIGIHLSELARKLKLDGLKQFETSYESLLQAIATQTAQP